MIKSTYNALKRSIPWLVLLYMLVTVMRTALAGPPTEPREEDRQKADRVIEQTAGVDLRIQRPEGNWIGGLGIVEPARPEVALAMGSGGRVAVLLVNEGMFVNGGDLLVELESGAERAALAAAEAELVSVQLDLRRVRGSVRSADVTALRRDAQAAARRSELSQASYKRLQSTVAAGGVSVEEADRALAQAEQDALTAEAAQNRFLSAEAGRPLDVQAAQARVDAATARRDQAAALLQLKRIVAPSEGEVLEVLYNVGEFVQPGGVEPLLVMGDTRSLRVRIDVDERDVDVLKRDGKALVTVDALPGVQFEGQIVEVARRMGRKNVRSDEPTERIDTKILEVVVDLGEADLIVGQRVMAYLERKGE